jgi:hypothetical protein
MDINKIDWNGIWREGTNYNHKFSDFNKVQSAATHVDDLIDRRTLTGQGGHFKFNWTTATSVVGGCIGSIARYTSNPSKLGLWSAGQPDTVTVNIRILGWITINGDSISTTTNAANTNNILEIQLQKFENGFLYNVLVPTDQLSQIDLLQPLNSSNLNSPSPSPSPSQEPTSSSEPPPEPFPTTLVVALMASVAVASAGLLVYLRKRKH